MRSHFKFDLTMNDIGSAHKPQMYHLALSDAVYLGGAPLKHTVHSIRNWCSNDSKAIQKLLNHLEGFLWKQSDICNR